MRTKHAARLSRHRESWMTYNNTILSLKLAWLGFGDPHCSIEYIVKIGTSLGMNDLITVRLAIFIPDECDEIELISHLYLNLILIC